MMNKSKILIIDDEKEIRKILRITLEATNYQVEEAKTGQEGLHLSAIRKPDLILLDLGLPDIDGTDVLLKLREWSSVPVIIVSVRDKENDIIGSLDKGANDYVTKPFHTGELLARVRANIRDNAIKEGFEDAEVKVGDLKIDILKHQVYMNNKIVDLTPKEYNLLMFLAKNAGKLITHKLLLEEVWGRAHTEDSQYLRIYIGNLRKKIEKNSSQPKYIITEPGLGYRFNNSF